MKKTSIKNYILPVFLFFSLMPAPVFSSTIESNELHDGTVPFCPKGVEYKTGKGWALDSLNFGSIKNVSIEARYNNTTSYDFDFTNEPTPSIYTLPSYQTVFPKNHNYLPNYKVKPGGEFILRFDVGNFNENIINEDTFYFSPVDQNSGRLGEDNAELTSYSIQCESNVNVFTETSCDNILSDKQEENLSGNYSCGWLSVPQEYGNEDSDIIHLAVLRLEKKNTNSDKKPIIYIQGGPGFPNIGLVSYSKAIIQNLNSDSDIYFMDPRGMGKSIPTMKCNEFSGQYTNDLSKIKACQERLASKGVNLDLYGTRQHAKDIVSLQKILGLRDSILFGSSYGTRVALSVLNLDGSYTQGLILDGTTPIEISSVDDNIEAFEHGLDRIIKNCNNSGSDCDSINLQKEINDSISEAINNSREVSAYNYVGLLMGEVSEPTLNDKVFNLFQDLDKVDDIVIQNDKLLFESNMFNFNNAAWLSVVCSEDANREHSYKNLQLSDGWNKAILDISRDFYNNTNEMCSLWGIEKVPENEKQPVYSTKPTLILSGVNDTATPPLWAKQVSDKLDLSILLEHPSSGHGVSNNKSDCINNILHSFVDNLTVSDDEKSCLVNIPKLHYEPALLQP